MWQSAKLCKIVQSATVSCTDAIKTAWTTGWCLKLAQFVTAHHAWCMDMAELHWNSWHETQLLVVTFPGKQNLSLICLPAHDTFAGDICQVRTSLFSLEKMEKDPNNGSSTYKSSTCKYPTTAQVHESNTFFTDQSMNLKSGVLFKHESDMWPMLRGWNGTHLQTCSCHCLGSRSRHLTSSDIMVKVPGVQESECRCWNQSSTIWSLSLCLATLSILALATVISIFIHALVLSNRMHTISPTIHNMPGLPLLLPPSGQSLALWQIAFWRKVGFVQNN